METDGIDAEITTKPDESVQRTLAIIKPEALPYADEIEEKIKEEDYKIIQKRIATLTRGQAAEFYSKQYGSPGFPGLVADISSGPIIVMCLSKKNAIEDWINLICPPNVPEARPLFKASLEAKYGDSKEDTFNGLHGSKDEEIAEKEIRFFFPEMIMEPLLTGESLTDYLAESVNPTLLEGLVQLCKVKPVDPVVWLADWLLINNPNKPQADEITATTPT